MQEQIKNTLSVGSLVDIVKKQWGPFLVKLEWTWRRHPKLLVGIAILIFMALLAIFAPLLWTIDPTAVDPPYRLKEPGEAYWFGSDFVGRDVWSRTIYGTRVSLAVGVAVGAMSGVTAAFFGLLAGYFNTFDLIIMRIIDAIMSIHHIL